MKKFFSFLFTVLIISAIGAMIYLHPTFFQRQLDKINGMYYVHKGDKALKELKLQKAINYYNRAVQLYPGEGRGLPHQSGCRQGYYDGRRKNL